jgi:hypothetical protein
VVPPEEVPPEPVEAAAPPVPPCWAEPEEQAARSNDVERRTKLGRNIGRLYISRAAAIERGLDARSDYDVPQIERCPHKMRAMGFDSSWFLVDLAGYRADASPPATAREVWRRANEGAPWSTAVELP